MNPDVYVTVERARRAAEKLGCTVEVEPDRLAVYFGRIKCGSTMLTEDRQHVSRYSFNRILTERNEMLV